MSTNVPLTIAVVARDASGAEGGLGPVKRALAPAGQTSSGANEIPRFVAISGGAQAARAWLADDMDANPGMRRMLVYPDAAAEDAIALLQAGANGVVDGRTAGWLLRYAAAVIQRGGAFLDPWLAHDVADQVRPRSGNLHGITGAQQRVLVRAARGMDIKAIAAELNISTDTVKGHLHSLQERLGATRQQIITAARSQGLLPSGQNRVAASTWELTRGLHGLTAFVVGHERLARETLAGALAGAGARIVGHGSGPDDVSAARSQWMVTVAITRNAEEELCELRTARPRAALLVVPWRLDARAVRGALAARAQGIVGIDARLDELVAAIRVAASAGLYLETAALRVVLEVIARKPKAVAPLTVRQLEVLALVDRGYSTRGIARELGVAEPTVKGHVREALRVLHVPTRHDAAASARRLGLLDAS